jgi:hypothetical protein
MQREDDMRPRYAAATAAVALLALTATPALACGGLIGPNGAVNLLKTTTLAAYQDGVEHYVTAFEFAGVGGGQFGSLVPLPDVPSSIVKGGAWTLQRLVRETDPVPESAVDFARAASAGQAEVLQQVRIDALDITVLRGGGAEVGEWATAHGFRLPPDAPDMLDFYAQRSPIFLAAVFDGTAARERGQQQGDGTPVHITIPTDYPWVPLRILGLGKTADETVQADVYLMTDAKPRLLPTPSGSNGLRLAHSGPATTSLLDDLRSDTDMDWVPKAAWLTKVEIDGPASLLVHDLAIAPDGVSAPSAVDAGFGIQAPTVAEAGWSPASLVRILLTLGFVGMGVALVALLTGRRPATPAI